MGKLHASTHKKPQKDLGSWIRDARPWQDPAEGERGNGTGYYLLLERAEGKAIWKWGLSTKGSFRGK